VESLVKTALALQVMILAALLAPAASAQTYAVPDDGPAAHKSMYRLRLDTVTHEDRTSLWPRRFFHVPGSDPPQFLELPSYMATGDWNEPSTIRLHEIGTEDRVLGEFEAAIWGDGNPAFCSGGRAVYLYLMGVAEHGLTCYELPAGKRIGQISSALNHAKVASDCDALHTRLVTEGWWIVRSNDPAAMPPFRVVRGFLVADLQSGAWIGRFPKPADGGYPDVYMSPDGRHFAASGFVHEPGTDGSHQHELIVFDLSSLPHEEIAKDELKEIERQKARKRTQAEEPAKWPWPFGRGGS
jgi:hypothetical protein